MTTKNTFPFYYDNQLKRYILHFMAVFSSLKVQHEDSTIQDFSVRYSDADRVSEAILAGNTQNAVLSLPIGTCYLQDIAPAPHRAKGTATIRVTPIGYPGSLPSEVEYVYQVQPKPYDLRFTLKIMASNSNQMFQLTEQICSLFDPTMQIQTSNSHTDPASVVMIKLETINSESDPQIGTERRRCVKSFNFLIEGWISTPIEIKKNIIETIHINLSMVEHIYADFDFSSITFSALIANVDTGEKNCV